MILYIIFIFVKSASYGSFRQSFLLSFLEKFSSIVKKFYRGSHIIYGFSGVESEAGVVSIIVILVSDAVNQPPSI